MIEMRLCRKMVHCSCQTRIFVLHEFLAIESKMGEPTIQTSGAKVGEEEGPCIQISGEAIIRHRAELTAWAASDTQRWNYAKRTSPPRPRLLFPQAPEGEKARTL